MRYAAKVHEMLSDVQEIVTRELSGLCGSCNHYDGCVYRKNSDKVVIQCEVFEDSGGTLDTAEVVLKGLCLNCSKAPLCHLPKQTSGVWHCEEYE